MLINYLNKKYRHFILKMKTKVDLKDSILKKFSGINIIYLKLCRIDDIKEL